MKLFQVEPIPITLPLPENSNCPDRLVHSFLSESTAVQFIQLFCVAETTFPELDQNSEPKTGRTGGCVRRPNVSTPRSRRDDGRRRGFGDCRLAFDLRSQDTRRSSSHHVRRQLGRDVTARLVSAFVLSRLDYCNIVLAGLRTATLAPLQRVLHAAARLVVDLRPRDHVSQALQKLHWLPIDKRIDYKLCLMVHKASIGQAPTYIADMLTPVSSVQSLSTQRSATNGDIASLARGLFQSPHLKLGTGCRPN